VKPVIKRIDNELRKEKKEIKERHEGKKLWRKEM